MSAEAEADTMCCASCGVAQVDDTKLKKCNDCDLVRYCSDKCQQEHRTQHEANCKERAAELRDEILFRQPESTHLGDCPICWHPLPKTGEESDRNSMKRVEANDPVAVREVGGKHYHEGDYESAFEYWTRAAELGDVDAHYDLSLLYQEGKGVEKDVKKEINHLEEAAIAGHPFARYNLACYEVENRRYERAVKHLIIAANLGYDESIKVLKKCYAMGEVRKEDFAAALRAHQAAVDATKSPQREDAAKAKAAAEFRR